MSGYLIKKARLKEILSDADRVGHEPDPTIDNFAQINEATTTSVIWVRGSSKLVVDAVKNSQAPIILVGKNFPVNLSCFHDRVFYICQNPRLSYARIVRSVVTQNTTWSIAPTAIIHPEAKIDKNVSIGPYCIIGKSTIQSGTVLHGHCMVHDHVEIGKRVHIHAHTCLGSDGFSFEWNECGDIEKFPHIGKCIIEDDVEIYPYANIDRGTLGTVRVGRGTKIDHYVHVGHNCRIGQNSIVTAGVVLCGGSQVGNNTWIGVQSTIKEKCIVGDNSLVGLNSLVTRDIPDNQLWMGSPAKFVRNRV